jgi:hypothetical protein
MGHSGHSSCEEKIDVLCDIYISFMQWDGFDKRYMFSVQGFSNDYYKIHFPFLTLGLYISCTVGKKSCLKGEYLPAFRI